ncbi:MAG: SCO family protein [Verrucomicrobia bacterium]|nr:SCO family protein [Verrucomicrobiota bacterium]
MSVASSKTTSVPSTPPRRPFFDWRVWTVAAVLLVAVGLSVLFGVKQNAQQGFFGMRLFPLKTAYDFKLTGPNGAEVRLDQFQGKTVLFLFGFTHCANICPTSLTNLTEVYRALTPEERKQVQVVFISVDPDRDKPQTLEQYVTSFDPSFIGLTAPKPTIDQTVLAYGASYEMVAGPTNEPNDYSVNHSAYTYLVNPSGKLELLYGNEKLADVQRVVSDIQAVLREPRS